jgi:hypothetical protein
MQFCVPGLELIMSRLDAYKIDFAAGVRGLQSERGGFSAAEVAKGARLDYFAVRGGERGVSGCGQWQWAMGRTYSDR